MNTEQQREAFEQKYAELYPVSVSLNRNKFDQEYGDYIDTCVQVAWTMYCALAAQPVSAGLTDAEIIAKFLDSFEAEQLRVLQLDARERGMQAYYSRVMGVMHQVREFSRKRQDSAPLSAAQRDSQPDNKWWDVYEPRRKTVYATVFNQSEADHYKSIGCRVVAVSPSQPVADTSADARDAAVQALVNIRDCLHRINQHESAIRDTLWYGDAETLFDYIDAAIAASKAQQ
jgi:hypothetical protein